MFCIKLLLTHSYCTKKCANRTRYRCLQNSLIHIIVLFHMERFLFLAEVE